jgi:hypothetical protein
VIDLTVLEGDEPICKTLFGQSDQDLAAQFGGAGDHRLERARLLDRGQHRRRPQRHRDQRHRPQGQAGRPEDLAVVNISFGGYLDPADPESAVAFQAYADAIAYARGKGTLIVGSAGATSWPTTSTTGPGSTWPRPVGPASSTWAPTTGAAPPGSLHQRRPDPRLADLRHRLQLGGGDPLLHLHRRLRVPPGPVLLDHPGHLDGRPARLGRGRPDRQRAPLAASPAGALVARLKATARSVHNLTPPLSATDTSPATSPGTRAPPGTATWAGRPSPTAAPTGPAWPMWPTREAQSAPDWWWRTRSTMLSRARGEKGLVK